MDRSTRSELQKTIEEQAEKLKRYESRLRDVVIAYKSSLKEKDALEKSLKVLSSSQASPVGQKTEGKDESSKKNPNAQSDPLGAKEESADSSEVDEESGLRQQLATLSTSLGTLTEEKNKLTASYQAEKKKLRQENEKAINNLEEENAQLLEKLKASNLQVDEVKAKLICQQHEREREQNDHALMLKELQKLLTDERNTRENTEHLFEEAKTTLKEFQTEKDNSVREHYEKKVHDLSNELEQVRQRLRTAEDKASAPSQLLLDLQQELAYLREQHRFAIQQEQQRADQGEEKANSLSLQSEERVSSLEAKLSDLSNVVGSYEKLRYQDQQAIQKLRDRVAQLDMENSMLAKAVHGDQETEAANPVEEDSPLDVAQLVEKILHLKDQLKKTAEKSGKEYQTHLEDLDDHTHCKTEYSQLKEEFERYKLRAQSVLKNKGSHKDTVPKEVESLKTQVGELREKLIRSEQHVAEQEQTHSETIMTLHTRLQALQEKHLQELASKDSVHNQRIVELEQEIRRHRDRTISLLAEKDRELESLKSKYPSESRYLRRYNSQSSGGSEYDGSAAAAAGYEEEGIVSQLLTRTSLSGSAGDTSLLHFAQEQARKDVELNSLRKQKHSLEMALRELQHCSLLKEEQYSDRIELLQEEIRKHERNKSRESANLEYLKNVVYQYMVCYDVNGRTQMLNAIATILQFSPREKNSIQQKISKGWWGGTSPKSGKS